MSFKPDLWLLLILTIKKTKNTSQTISCFYLCIRYNFDVQRVVNIILYGLSEKMYVDFILK